MFQRCDDMFSLFSYLILLTSISLYVILVFLDISGIMCEHAETSPGNSFGFRAVSLLDAVFHWRSNKVSQRRVTQNQKRLCRTEKL